MHNDPATLKDLSVFAASGGLFGLLDHTRTHKGREALRRIVLSPPNDFASLQALQDTVKFFATHNTLFPPVITNGTLVMLDKFFESADFYGVPPKGIGLALHAFFHKILNRNEYTFNRSSVSHLTDFLRDCHALASLSEQYDLPPLLLSVLTAIREELEAQKLIYVLAQADQQTSYQQMVRLSYAARRELKNPVFRLMQYYATLDAWQAIAKATQTYRWVFPELRAASPLVFRGEGLYHPLLKRPVGFDMAFDQTRHLLLLTGANMSGKTTLMRTLGTVALLAHIGSGVPAASLELSFLNGIITNMHVEDDLMRGESYFFAEVKRMKQTAQLLQSPHPHLVLMDELFKGTNVHDAFECTRAVTQGLLRYKHHILVLSTHLYEVAEQFKDNQHIRFARFVTDMTKSGGYAFPYTLREGISNDRIGYRILEQEGILALLDGRNGNPSDTQDYSAL